MLRLSLCLLCACCGFLDIIVMEFSYISTLHKAKVNAQIKINFSDKFFQYLNCRCIVHFKHV